MCTIASKTVRNLRTIIKKTINVYGKMKFLKTGKVGMFVNGNDLKISDFLFYFENKFNFISIKSHRECT